MALFSEVQAAGITIRESANDGSDFSNPAADYRRLFLGEDGLLHVKDSAGAVTSPYTGSGDVATDAIWDAAGDLAVGTGANTAAKLAKGSDLDVLTISASTHVPVWAAPAASVSADLLPWHIFIPAAAATPDATTGTWAQNNPGDVSSIYAGMIANAASNAQNDAIAWDIVLAAGTWDVHFWVRESTNTAIITLNFASVSKGTADTYNGSAVYAKVSVTGISVATTAKIQVQAKAATRNGSNSTGWVLAIFAVEFHRTA